MLADPRSLHPLFVYVDIGVLLGTRATATIAAVRITMLRIAAFLRMFCVCAMRLALLHGLVLLLCRGGLRGIGLAARLAADLRTESAQRRAAWAVQC